MTIERREIGELIETREDAEEGVVEAYLTKWDTVDSYNSTFKKGAFAKSFRDRKEKGKIKLLFNHDQLAGKILKASEDNIGPKIVGKFNLNTDVGRNAWEHVKAGDVDAFSFAFRILKERKVDGVRVIQDVDCMECGPVVFPANQEAEIFAMRAQDFDTTWMDQELSAKGWNLIYALQRTLEDIQFQSDKSEWDMKAGDAIDRFKTEYIAWIDEYMGFYQERGFPFKNEIQAEFHKILEYDSTLEFASKTEFTLEEADKLNRGEYFDLPADEERRKFKAYPDLLAACNKVRDKEIGELVASSELLTDVKKRELAKQWTKHDRDQLADFVKELNKIRERIK